MKSQMAEIPSHPEPPRVLISGDFWHHEFSDLISGLDVPAMILPWPKLTQLKECPGSVEMIVIGQASRGSIDASQIDAIQRIWPQVPVLIVLGSWCEGESRSGQPIAGVKRVLWHQWQGQYQQLRQWLSVSNTQRDRSESREFASDQTNTTTSDHSQMPSASAPTTAPQHQRVAVSALSSAQFEMAQDALELLGLTAVWAEKSIWQAEELEAIVAVCLDCESLTENLTNRLIFLRKQFPEQPVFLFMGFPRKHEVQSLKSYWNVSGVISKPIDITSLAAALEQAGIAVPTIATTRLPTLAPANFHNHLTTNAPVSGGQ